MKCLKNNIMDNANNISNKHVKPLLVPILFALILFIMSGCGESFLQPQPQSFLSPQIFHDKRGLRGVLTNLARGLRAEYFGSHMRILTEYYFTDIAIAGGGPPTWPHNLKTQLTPTGDVAAKTRQYWTGDYAQIKYANLVIDNVDNVKNWNSKKEQKAMLAVAYFYRSYWYYRLVNQFGDVPVTLTEINKPRLNFNTYKREAILKKYVTIWNLQ